LASMVFISSTASLIHPRWASSCGSINRICMRSLVFSLLWAAASCNRKNVIQICAST
jgi:hypothetical protein